MSQPVTAPPRPPAPKGALPAGVVLARYWREAEGGPLVKHDHDRPVDEQTDRPVGVWWMCPDDSCRAGEWTFRSADTGALNRPKKRFCDQHGHELAPGKAEATAGNPKQAARTWLKDRMAEKAAEARQRAVAVANARIQGVRAAGQAEARKIASDLREHVPSAGVSLAALVGDYTLLEHLSPVEGYLAAGLLAGGAVLAYLIVYSGELVYARRMGYTIRELPAVLRARARSHARWIASGLLATGVWLLIAETIGADLANLRGLLMSLFGAVLAGVVNYTPWATMVQRRKDAARAAREAAEAQARAEEERLAAERRAREERQRAAEQARIAAEQATLAEAKKIVNAEDDRITAGRKFAERWRQLAEEAKARANGLGFEIWRTEVVVEETRKLTAKVDGEQVVIGHEFLIKAEPGVLAPRGGMNVSPFLQMKTWLSSMLELGDGMLDLAYQPKRLADDGKGEEKTLVNHGLVTLFDSHPLGEPVKHPGGDGVFVDDKGVRWGFAGRDLRGRVVHRRQWTPGQAGGGIRVGVTGMGKSVTTQVTAYNDLLLGVLPIIHDAGKNAMDFVDFYGIFPVGHTIEHREVIRESLWAEMKRRQAWINTQTAAGLGGMEVTADPTWDPVRGGPPIRVTWEEFHMHAKDQKFVQFLSAQVRLQRATAIMAEGASQGSGLTDWVDQNLKEQMAEILLQLMRVSDHTARISGYAGSIMPSSLPNLAGMMVMQELKGEPIAYRSAFIPRDPQNPESLIYRMKQPNGTPEGEQILFAPRLPAETVEVFEQYGLMDLWELGKTKAGRERLQAEADPVESTAYPDSLAAAFAQQAPVASKPRMRAEEVVLAMLKLEVDKQRPGLTPQEMLASPWWAQVDGEWSKSAGVPSHTTISRACNRLTAGDEPLLSSDGQTPARWQLCAAGYDRAEQMLNLLRGAGVLGPQGRAQVQAAGVDVAAIERQAQLEAEQEYLIRDLMREAMGVEQ